MTEGGIFYLAANDVYTDMTLAEKLAIGGETALLGILIVFFILILLWAALELFHVVFYILPQKRKERLKKQTKQTVQAHEKQLYAEPSGKIQTEESELVAAISAAVAVYTDRKPGTFRVVSFRRVGGSRR